MSENSRKKLDKNAPDKTLTPEQAIVNASITQAAALMEIAECMNDIADAMDVMRELAIKTAVKNDVINQIEAAELTPPEDEEADEPQS